MELYLIRHTKPKIACGFCYGQTDLEVADDYPKALTALQQKFANLNVSVVYSSPLQRCQRLAADLFSKTAITDVRLMEVNFGLWEMMAWQDVAKQALDDWAADIVHFTPPNGESLFDLDQRVDAFFQALCTQIPPSKDKKVAIIAHAGVIRCLLSALMKMPLTAHLHWQIDYGSVSKVIVNDQFVRLCYANNQTNKC